MDIAENDINDLRYAKTILENPSLAARISNLLGTPIEKGFEHLVNAKKTRFSKFITEHKNGWTYTFVDNQTINGI